MFRISLWDRPHDTSPILIEPFKLINVGIQARNFLSFVICQWRTVNFFRKGTFLARENIAVASRPFRIGPLNGHCHL